MARLKDLFGVLFCVTVNRSCARLQVFLKKKRGSRSRRSRRSAPKRNHNRRKKRERKLSPWSYLPINPFFPTPNWHRKRSPMSTMRSRALLLATAVLLVTGGAAAQAVYSEPDADAPAPRKRASVAEPDADAAAAPVAPRRAVAAPVADDATVAAPVTAAPAAVSAVADAGGSSEEPQGLRPKTQLATKYEPGQKILNDEGLPLVDRYVAGSLVKSVRDSGGNTVCEMVLQGE